MRHLTLTLTLPHSPSPDPDQVKECAISCVGLVLAHLGDACAAEVPAVLPILLERLRNEITRVTTVRSFPNPTPNPNPNPNASPAPHPMPNPSPNPHPSRSRSPKP